MCGLAGFLSFSGPDAAPIALRMADALAHRGPDDHGLWQEEAVGLALAHRRLAIVDLSPAGHQPMVSAGGRYVVVFNGEIYNHLTLRKDLGERPWRGHSDTETLLAAVESWGLAKTLDRLVGMFSLALWDRQDRTLTLARDRLGEKPLYYGWQQGVFLFGSELKALAVHPAFQGTLNRDALALFFRYNCIPAPHSIYQGIHKLPPGCSLAVRCRPDGSVETGATAPYWRVAEAAQRGQGALFQGSAEEAREELERLLRQSVAGQMVADVPLGAFLSGGIDSSTIVALMQAQSTRPVRTFTIGFEAEGYDEAHHARAVADHLGCDHTELRVSPEDARAVIPRLPSIYDEPFADSSQIPTVLVAQLARQHVTVSLSGDGGDELFGGYNRHTWGPGIWRRMRRVPRPLRQGAAAVLTAVPPETWNRLFQGLGRALPPRLRQQNPGDKLHKLAGVLPELSPEGLYRRLVSHWADPAALVLGARDPGSPRLGEGEATALDLEHQMMALDMVGYLPDDILVKVDRAAMAASLETRVPFLDHRVVEFAWSLPLDLKIRKGQGKWLLRQVLAQHVPQGLIDRPKMGFGVPLDQWLRGPLRDWGEGLLEESRLRQGGLLDPAPIRRLWQEHLTGRRNWAYPLWDVVMFQAWLDR